MIKDLKIQNYDSLPCSLEIFTINSQEADKDDFEESFIREGYKRIEYGCSYRDWKRTNDEDQIKETMAKYNITRADFEVICDELEEVLDVGPCGWCV